MTGIRTRATLAGREGRAERAKESVRVSVSIQQAHLFIHTQTSVCRQTLPIDRETLHRQIERFMHTDRDTRHVQIPVSDFAVS